MRSLARTSPPDHPHTYANERSSVSRQASSLMNPSVDGAPQCTYINLKSEAESAISAKTVCSSSQVLSPRHPRPSRGLYGIAPCFVILNPPPAPSFLLLQVGACANIPDHLGFRTMDSRQRPCALQHSSTIGCVSKKLGKRISLGPMAGIDAMVFMLVRGKRLRRPAEI
ncbi:hypothetical protein PYCCODRAFT_1204215 [Trametes coccinea BRFM310]|uniref:Uncharacterized protein n=1 Tax=Trametes coccinea (strain BRFM310) TaxID=1353009 RepID=A0A1Y2I7E3_TRAC3|nr:hypothetical protein PYCCODRAFT_1204215 [Trametes coccinea BRFM310]